VEQKFIQIREGVMLGKPTVAGTRITVELILEKLAAGESIEQVMQSHPRLTEESVRETLRFAGRRVGEVLERLGLTNRRLIAAVNELDNKADEERLGLSDRRVFPEDPGPTAFQAIAETVSVAGISESEAFASMERIPASNAPLILEKIAEEEGVERFGSKYGLPRADALVALAFASEVLRIYR
jgi:uncharacterized protein (DUF433 family)